MDSITDFMESVDINIHLSDLGIKQDDLGELADNVTGSIESDPASIDKTIIQKIYSTAYINISE